MKPRAPKIRLKRVYEDPNEDDGTRILVDRLWPRGLSKERARVDVWLKEVAPSHELRKRFGHDPARWEQFQADYRRELDANTAATEQLRALLAAGPATILYGARDEEHNEAVVLKEWLLSQ